MSVGREARHYPGPGRLAHWLPVLLVLALLGSTAAAYRYEWGPRHLPWLVADPATEPQAVAPPAGLDLPQWTDPAPAAAAAPAGTALDPVRVEALLASGLTADDLGPHVVAAVGDLAGTGTDWTSGDGTYLPASNTKLLTAAAVLEQLGPQARFSTRVVTGRTPRDVVLVGGGDPYLASRPTGSGEATFPARADVVALARATADSLGERTRVRLRYDDGLFTGPTGSAAWRDDYIPDDIVAPITALMVDGGREDDGWGRVDDPSLEAARAFAAGLRAAGIEVVGAPKAGAAPVGAGELASVESAPLADIVEHVLDVSDNEGAEVLAHQVGLASVGEGSFAGGARGVLDTLDGLGVDITGAKIHDGSGLSRRNRVTTATVLGVLRQAASADDTRTRSVLTGLSVAGFTGSLTYRFDAGAPRALGVVRAKTGTLTGVHALAGTVTGRDGLPMVFVIAADRVAPADSLEARATIDRLVASLATCRCAVPG